MLAGGTWLFSEPQPDLHTLVDLRDLGWTPLEVTPAGLTIAATCTLRQLAEWTASPLLHQCCAALAGSFKIWHEATVGGNICLGLPAGPMIAMAAAGLGTPDDLHPVQRRFIDTGGFQCGFCTPGMVVTASKYRAAPDLAAIPQVLKSNLCRCTGYRSIVDALRGVVNTDKGGATYGHSLPSPAAAGIVTGTEPYTLDAGARR